CLTSRSQARRRPRALSPEHGTEAALSGGRPAGLRIRAKITDSSRGLARKSEERARRSAHADALRAGPARVPVPGVLREGLREARARREGAGGRRALRDAADARSALPAAGAPPARRCRRRYRAVSSLRSASEA